MKIRYNAPGGAPCEGTMSFDFHQETETKLRTKRSATYKSNFELTNVKILALTVDRAASPGPHDDWQLRE